MKKLIPFLFLFIVTAGTINAQKKTYFGLGAGANNISGMIGLNFETPIDTNFSIKAGIGSGWGMKFGISGKYYKSYPTSVGFGLGFSYAGGGTAKDYEVEQKNGTKAKTELELKPAQMIDLTICKSWGQRVRFNLEFGYSIKIAGGDYVNKNTAITISDNYDKAIKFTSPGGLILAAGLSFGF
jgi:hypothetical protein